MANGTNRDAKLAALDAAIGRGRADKNAGRTVPIEDVTAEWLATLDTVIERALVEPDAGKGKPATEVFDRLRRKYYEQAREDRGRARVALKAINKQMAKECRTTPPPADDADAWVVAIDQDTGRASWTARALMDAFWALRSALCELDDDDRNSKERS